MSTILIVLKSNFRRAFNEKAKFIISFLVPLVAITCAMFANYIGTPSINIGIVEKSNFEEQQRITNLLKDTNGIKIKNADENTLKTDLILSKYDGVITFKKDFSKGDVNENSIKEYFDFYTIKDKKIAESMEGIVKAYIYTDKAISLESMDSEFEKGQLSKACRIISFLLTVLIITSVINGAVITKDKSENTLLRFMYSPNKRFQYILGNVFFNYIISYIQLSFALIITKVLGMDLDISLTYLLLYGLLLVLVTTTLGTFIASLFKKELYANMFASAISLTLSLIGGAFIPYDKMPKGLQILSNITPNRWVIESVNYLENGLTTSFSPIAILVVFSVVFAIAATVVTKMQKLEMN